MWGKSCRRLALLVPCATTAQWASYAISLLSKMRFVWVNRAIITIPEQMCLRCAAKRCRLQDEVCEFNATFQRCMCDLRQANHFAVSLPSVLPSLSPSLPPPLAPWRLLHPCDCQCHCDRDRSVCLSAGQTSRLFFGRLQASVTSVQTWWGKKTKQGNNLLGRKHT